MYTMEFNFSYLHLSDPIVSSNKRVSKEEVEDAITQSLRMNGIAIANVKLIEAMGGQEVLNYKQTKEGKYTGMPIVSQEDFEHKNQKEAEKENQEHRQSNVPSSFRDEPSYWKIFIPMFYHRKYK